MHESGIHCAALLKDPLSIGDAMLAHKTQYKSEHSCRRANGPPLSMSKVYA
jgi:hypothetical protein